jgi:hypothetical protein
MVTPPAVLSLCAASSRIAATTAGGMSSSCCTGSHACVTPRLDRCSCSPCICKLALLQHAHAFAAGRQHDTKGSQHTLPAEVKTIVSALSDTNETAAGTKHVLLAALLCARTVLAQLVFKQHTCSHCMPLKRLAISAATLFLPTRGIVAATNMYDLHRCAAPASSAQNVYKVISGATIQAVCEVHTSLCVYLTQQSVMRFHSGTVSSSCCRARMRPASCLKDL